MGKTHTTSTTIISLMKPPSLPLIASFCTIASCGASSLTSGPQLNNGNGVVLFAPPPRQNPSMHHLPRRKIGWSSSSSLSLVYPTQNSRHHHPSKSTCTTSSSHGFGTTSRRRRERVALKQSSFQQPSSPKSSPLSLSSSSESTTSTTSMLDDTAVGEVDDYFDNAQFTPYAVAIEEILSKRNVMRDFRKNELDLAVVKERLLERRRILPIWEIDHFLAPPNHGKADAEREVVVDGHVGKQSSSSQLKGDNSVQSSNGEKEGDSAVFPPTLSYTRQKLRQRSQMYLDATGLTSSQHKLATVLLAHLVDHCAKHSTPEPLHVAWEKVLEGGLVPLSRTLSTYLYVFSLEDNEEEENDSEKKEKDSNALRRDIAAEVAMFHDAIYPPTEKTITLLVKSLVGRGDAQGAEALLESIATDSTNGQLRHRTTSPILRLYCEKGDIDSALRLYHKMRSTSRVKMDASTYANFIAAVAQHGYFRPDSNCIVGAQDLGYNRSCGPDLLNSLLLEMAEDVLDISEESARVLHNGFALGFHGSGLDVLSDTETMRITTTRCENGSLVANRVLVDNESAICSATGATLRLIVLEQSQRVHVHDTLLEMAREKSKEYTAKLASKGRSTNDNAEKAELATQILKEFSEWLDTRSGKPYTAIVDGANVAYFGWGRVNVYQLMHMVNALERQGEHPLVIFPQKYTLQRFHLRQGMLQVLREEEMAYLEELKEREQMYVVPPMCLDDLCKFELVHRDCPTPRSSTN
jgi:pentatricopeptide repeat protein